MKKILWIYWAFIKQQFKSLMEYKIDFLLGVIGLGITQAATFLLMFAVFTQIKSIGSYNFYEILLFFGYAQMIRGIDHIYNDNLWFVSQYYIRDGRFYQFLIRPINTILLIVMEKICMDGFGELLVSAAIICFAASNLGLMIPITQIPVIIIFILSGLAIYFAIKLAFASIALWTTTSGELMTLGYEINSFSRYPLEIYSSNVIKFLITFVLPFAVVSYFPIVYFIRDNDYLSKLFGIPGFHKEWIILFVAVIAGLSVSLALFIWKKGLKNYQASAT